MEPTIIESDIIYKQITVNDFDIGFDVKSKNISPDENGFVSKQVSSHFLDDKENFDKSETVLLNFGVGQGKSTTLNNLVNQYLSDGYLAIILVPFKSLIDKYYNEFENLGDNRFNYRIFEEDDFRFPDVKDAVLKDLHILSMNAFLRDPGDNHVMQSQIKQLFLNSLHKRCKEDSKKVVLFIDEIHASIHNFQRDKIFHLLKWSDVIHKAFIASATFTETSIQVSKYISLLTQKNISILKGERHKNKERRADVKLLINNSSYSAKSINSLKKLIPIIKDGLETNKKINILSYSKKLANKVFDEYKELFKEFKVDLKLCTSETDYEFNEEHQAHVGTNFSTGVNINGGIFIILLPPHSLIEGLGTYGTFSGGYIALIQSIARMRTKGVIYICSSLPTKLLEGEYLKNIVDISPDFKTCINHNLSQQSSIIKKYYKELKEEHKKPIEFINSIKNSPEDFKKHGAIKHYGIELNYPTYEEFLLKYGDKLLYTKYYSYGNKVLPYLFWALFNDQFQNAKLTEVIIEEPKELNFTDENIIDVIYETLSKEYHTESSFGNSLCGLAFLKTEKEILLDFQAALSCYTLKLNEKKVFPRHYKVVKALLNIIACKLMGNDSYSDKNYFNDCIQFSEKSNTQDSLIKSYKKLGKLKSSFLEFIDTLTIEIKGDFYLPSTISVNKKLPKNIYSLATIIIEKLNDEDTFLKEKVFSLLRDKKNPSESQIYTKLCDIFLKVDVNSQKRIDKKRYNKYMGSFKSKYAMNLIFDEERDSDEFLDENVLKNILQESKKDTQEIPMEFLQDSINDTKIKGSNSNPDTLQSPVN